MITSLGFVVGNVKWEDLKAFLNFRQMIHTFFFCMSHHWIAERKTELFCSLHIGVFHCSTIPRCLPHVLNGIHPSFHIRC